MVEYLFQPVANFTYARAYYDTLCRALEGGTKLDVDGNISYLFVYAYELLGDWAGKGFPFIHDGLRQLERLYPEEPKFADGCRMWALDCLLAEAKYDAYLEATALRDPADVFRKATHPANLRCNVAYLAGRPAAPEDLVRMSAFKASALAKKHPAAFVECLQLAFGAAAEQQGPWLARCMAMEKLQPYDETLFQGAPLRKQPKAPFQTYAFYAVKPYLEAIVETAKTAQGMLKASL